MTIKKICIVGPGAVGGMMAVYLERVGYQVSALARPEKAAAINATGIKLLDDGQTFIGRPKAASDPRDLGPQDLLIVTVKSDGLPWAAEHLAALSHDKTPWVFALNGIPWWFFSHFGGKMKGLPLKSVDPDGSLMRIIPLERLIWGVVNCRVAILDDGTLHHEQFKDLHFGRPDQGLEGVADVAKIFADATYTATPTDQIHHAIWNKLLANVVFNPLSALTLATSDRMLADPLVRDLAVKVTDEVRAVGAALGIPGGPSGAERFPPGRASRPVKTSMLADVERGRSLEVAPLIGAVAEIASLSGVSIPFTSMLYGLLRLRAQANLSN